MRIERKLDYFAGVMFDEAERAKRQHARESTARRSTAVSAALEEVQVQISANMREHSRKTRAAHYKELAHHTAALREGLWQQRQRLTEQLYAEAEARVKDFIVTEEYIEHMNKAIRIAAEEGGFFFVELAARDVERVNVPEGLQHETAKENIIGGFILYDKERKVRADYSFTTLLNRALHSHAH